MRLGVDASNLRGGGGITHLAELLRAAQPELRQIDRVVVWGSTATLSVIEERPWLRKQSDPLLNRGLLFRLYWQRFKLAELATTQGCDVLLVPGGSDASGFKPMLTMSRNLLPFEWREMRRYGFAWRTLKNALLHFAQKRSFRRADGLIFLSHYAHDVVMKFVGSRGQVTVVPHGIDTRFFLAPRAQHALGHYNEQNPLKLLYVSVVDVYKHQWHVAEAVARLRESGLPVTLDLVGPAYSPALKRLHTTLKRVDPGSHFIRYLGAVAHGKLHELYAAADINIFASSCENLPNILLEGMAAGLPTACSNRGPMPEVLGSAGVYFDPENPDQIATAIRSLIESPDLRLEKAEGAFRLAQQYSWARCADETMTFIRQVSATAV